MYLVFSLVYGARYVGGSDTELSGRHFYLELRTDFKEQNNLPLQVSITNGGILFKLGLLPCCIWKAQKKPLKLESKKHASLFNSV